MEPATINWYHSPIERDTLHQLTRKCVLKGWLQAGSFLLIYLPLAALASSLSLVRLWVPTVIASYVRLPEHDEHGRRGARAGGVVIRGVKGYRAGDGEMRCLATTSPFSACADPQSAACAISLPANS